ncbi:MAG: M23 family metallopeptidase [Bdellovibrionales bacterium]|nr:M23 family metallopeptidase [Bdellovibrionales bacterium]
MAFSRIFILMGLVFILFGCGHLEMSTYHNQSNGYVTQKRSPSGFIQGPFQLHWPVDNVRLTQKFRPKKRRPHQGIDLGGQRHTPIFAAHEGYVIYAGSGFKGYGRMIIVQYDNQWASLYAHLQKIQVKEGDYVSTRQQIGTMGRTGRATGVHLHFELMEDQIPIDPLPYLEKDHRIVKY